MPASANATTSGTTFRGDVDCGISAIAVAMTSDATPDRLPDRPARDSARRPVDGGH
jgi:hypothetical protein